MFSGVRLRLTLVYVLAAALLVAFIGGGVYALMVSYFDTTTDLALRYRAATELRALGVEPGAELAAAERQYAASRVAAATREPSGGRDGEEQEHEGERPPQEGAQPELAPIFVLALGPGGKLLGATGAAAPIAPDTAALAAALAGGSDARTVAAGGARVRLLTYRVDEDDGGVAALQVGRELSDQDALLSGLLARLLGIAAAAVGLVGAAAWWAAGRSLAPAREAWERQQSFIANASHELRTPITIVRASAEVALRGLGPADADRRELLGDVLAECDHMGRLVDDLLTLSRLDAGQLRLEPGPVALGDLLGDVARQAGRAAEERGVRVGVAGAEGVALADATRLRQVLLILIDNALRHTPAGGSVTLAAGAEAAGGRGWPRVEQAPGGQRSPAVLGGAGGRLVAIAVEDTGSGIAAEHLPHLFERFYRVDGARGGEGGAGLGLAIARAIVEAHGGRISVESAVGRGTRVVVRVPAAGPATA